MTRHRGAILLEVILSLAIVIGAGLALTGVVRQAIGAADRARTASEGDDLARSAMSLIDLGLARPSALTGPTDGNLLGRTAITTDDRPIEPRWRIEIESEPSAHAGLTLYTVRVLDASGVRTIASLRQLIEGGAS